MKCLLITLKGGENSAINELKKFKIIGKKENEGVIFNVDTYEKLLNIIYYSQSALRILLIDFPEKWIKGKTFAARSKDKDEERRLGEEFFNKGFKVDLSNPEFTLFSHNGIIGLDVSGNLQKRSFRVFTNRQTISGPSAFLVLDFAGYDKNKTLIDPFCKDGTLILEATHIAMNKSVRFYDCDFPLLTFIDLKIKNCEQEPNLIYAVSPEFRDLAAAKKNAKIAGVMKNISFSRQTTEWLDIKFDKKFDLLVTYLPTLNEKQLDKFCEQAKLISKKAVILLSNNLEKGTDLIIGNEIKKVIVLE